MTTASRVAQRNPISLIEEQVRHARAYHEHVVIGSDVSRIIPTSAASATAFDLSRNLVISSEDEYLLGISTPSVNHGHAFAIPAPKIVAPGEAIEVDPLSVIRGNSVAASAGTRILIAQLPQDGAVEGVPVLYGRDSLLRNIDPYIFALVADGSDAATSPLPLHDQSWSWDDCPTYAVRSQITRAARRAVGGDGLHAAAMIAIMRGLGELADRLLLSAILAETPAEFSIGAVSARHARFSELRALVGTAGTGAVVGQDGVLRANGVLAELTASATQTVIGRYTRTAVAVRPEIRVIARRLDAEGTTELTAFANMIAIAPNAAGDFWTGVSA